MIQNTIRRLHWLCVNLLLFYSRDMIIRGIMIPASGLWAIPQVAKETLYSHTSLRQRIIFCQKYRVLKMRERCIWKLSGQGETRYHLCPLFWCYFVNWLFVTCAVAWAGFQLTPKSCDSPDSACREVKIVDPCLVSGFFLPLSWKCLWDHCTLSWICEK